MTILSRCKQNLAKQRKIVYNGVDRECCKVIDWITLHKEEALLYVGVFLCIYIVLRFMLHRSPKRLIRKLAKSKISMTPEEFADFRLEKDSKGRTMASAHNFPGIYILHNHTQNIYYVGQGQRVLDRVNMHFTGKGNGDVYADYKYGEKFTIKILALKGSGFDTLNELERHAIDLYDAYENGYNKQRGNK